MALLTAAALEGYREYTKSAISYIQYKVGSTYYKAKISSVSTQGNNKLVIDAIIDHTVAGNITITEVQIYNTNNQLWLSKPESIVRKNTQEGVLYRFTFTITEG